MGGRGHQARLQPLAEHDRRLEQDQGLPVVGTDAWMAETPLLVLAQREWMGRAGDRPGDTFTLETSMPIKTITTAALYGRVSTTNHQQDVELQMEELRRVADQKGWETVEFIDEGVSGSKDSRPALDYMMAAVRAGEVGVVLCWRFDRFARSVRHLLEALDEFRSFGVEFVSVQENIDTSTPMGKMVFVVTAAVAELERELLLERVRAGVARARAQGKKFGRPRRDLDLRAAKALIEQGHTVRQVADMLGLPRTTLRRRLDEADLGAEVA